MAMGSVEGTAVAQAPQVGLRSRILTRLRADQLVYVGILAWSIAFTAGALLKQRFFLLGRYDLGNFTQAVWSSAHGHLLQVTEVGGEQVSRLGIHVDPIILGLVPLWWIWSSPNLLLVVQVVALAAGALPLYWLGRKHLQSSRDAALICAAYLISPVLEWNALHEFDAVALSVPLLLACIWFLDEERFWAFGVVAVLAVLCQEQIGVIVACLGAVYGWRTRRWVSAATIVALGLSVTALDLRVVMPHFSDGSPYASRFMGVGGSVGGVLTMSVTHPLAIIQRVLGAGHLFGLALVFVPVLAICFRSTMMLAAAPQLAFVLLSARIPDVAPWSQNLLPIVPFIFAGTVYALRPRSETPKWRAGHVLVASLACAAFFGPLTPWLLPLPSVSLHHVAAERNAVALVPPSAAVSTTNDLGAHLAARRYLYVFPVVGKATWIVLDEKNPELPNVGFLHRRHGTAVWKRDLYAQPKLMRSYVRRLEANSHWTRVFSSDGVMVFERRPAQAR